MVATVDQHQQNPMQGNCLLHRNPPPHAIRNTHEQVPRPMSPVTLTLSPGCASHRRIMVSSLLMVLPLPVGAPSSTLSSVWYSVWKA
jgi:hypothetical protein